MRDRLAEWHLEERPDPTHAGATAVNVSAAGIHVYNRDGITTATDLYDLYPGLGLLQSEVRTRSTRGRR